jgi:hypothetical protein
VIAAPLIRLEAVVETVEGIDRHVFFSFVGRQSESRYQFGPSGRATSCRV